MINSKLSPHRFWTCHEDRLIKTIQATPHDIYLSFMSAPLYFTEAKSLTLVYHNPKFIDANSQAVEYRRNRFDETVVIAGPKPLLIEFGVLRRLQICYHLLTGKLNSKQK